jgi:chromate transporter
MLNVTNSSQSEPAAPVIPAQTYSQLFRRFFRFGLLAWGGPVAQIDMIRNELVAQERWVTPEHFRRLLAIYQVLPGPEAHELCVHFGMLARGRWGGILAGLGFMLPGLALILLLSWLYIRVGLTQPAFHAVFLGVQPAVIALIVRGCHRIAVHALVDTPLLATAFLAAAAELGGVSFWFTLTVGGIAYVATAQRRKIWLVVVAVGFLVGAAMLSPVLTGQRPLLLPVSMPHSVATHVGHGDKASPPQLFASGLRAGLLTFGGAYTAIPFLERDAVEKGGWMSHREFLDGVALTGILPAPLIIFSTFVGFLAGGLGGALAMTAGVFLPAFSFSLLFHRHLEAVVHHAALRRFLEGVTAAVVGIIAATTLRLAVAAIPNALSVAICVGALLLLYTWKSKAAVPIAIFSAGIAGWIFVTA